jgi:hypothetical protein
MLCSAVDASVTLSTSEARTPVKPPRLESERVNGACHNPHRGQTETTPAKVGTCNCTVNSETPSRQRATVFFDTADGGQLIVSYDAPGQQVRPSPRRESLYFRHGFGGRQENLPGPKTGYSRVLCPSNASHSLADSPCLKHDSNTDSIPSNTRYFSDDIGPIRQDSDQFEFDETTPAMKHEKTLMDVATDVLSTGNGSELTPLNAADDKRTTVENLNVNRLPTSNVKNEAESGLENPVCKCVDTSLPDERQLADGSDLARRGHEKTSDCNNSDAVFKFMSRPQTSHADVFQTDAVCQGTDAMARKCAKDSECFKTPLQQPAKVSRSVAASRRLSSIGCESSCESRKTKPSLDRTTTGSYRPGRLSDVGPKTPKTAVGNKFGGAELHTRPVTAAATRSSVSSVINKQVPLNWCMLLTYLLSAAFSSSSCNALQPKVVNYNNAKHAGGAIFEVKYCCSVLYCILVYILYT